MPTAACCITPAQTNTTSNAAIVFLTGWVLGTTWHLNSFELSGSAFSEAFDADADATSDEAVVMLLFACFCVYLFSALLGPDRVSDFTIGGLAWATALKQSLQDKAQVLP